LAGASIFTLIDLNWGFWNVSLDEQSRQYTGFVVPERGVFTWTVMPFGLKTSPTIFQRAIEIALREVIDEGSVSVYIDDIIIFTKTVPEHLTILERVFKLLHAGGFFINWSKMKLFRNEILYLGHLVSANQLKPDPAKIQGIVNASAPQDKRALLSFCAAANYLRVFIPRFSELMLPLTNLTGKYTRFKWDKEQQDAFNEVKDKMINACYLTMPKWNKPFILFTDASEVAVAAVLAQLTVEEDSLDYVGFASKKLSETQRNWSTTERELYAIVWACEHYSQLLKGNRPLVYSDHKSLEHLISLDTPKCKRWALRLSEFQPYVTHIGGRLNNLADWLSRSLTDDEECIPNYMYVPSVYHLVHDADDLFTLPEPAEMREEAKREEIGLPPGTLDWYEDIPYGRTSRRMYIPTKYRTQLLLWFHTSRFGGHQGITRTTNRIRKYVWWPNLQLTVTDFINSCPICNSIKPLPTTKGHQGALESPGLFTMISMDFIGPRTYLNKVFYILVIVDHYSRYMVTVVTYTRETPTVETAMRDHWVSKFGVPKLVIADKAGEFKDHTLKRYIERTLLSQFRLISTEYPQGNGINESSHRILETAIKTSLPYYKNSIESIVADATLLYNVTPNRRIGDTPSSLVFGIDLHLPGLQDFEPKMTEESRLTQLRNYRGVRLLLKQLSEIEEYSPIRKDRSSNINFKIGDIITYRLSKSERDKTIHLSKESKYTATRSFPQRVVKVTTHDLMVKPLWTKGDIRTAPKEQCKLITTFIPELMREEVQQLYPRLPWLKSTDVLIDNKTSHQGEEITSEPPEEDTLTSIKPPSRKRFRRE
jgi:transposase InsO family protein